MLNYQLRFGSRPDIALLKSSTSNETRERRKELHEVRKMIRNEYDITYITRPTSDLMRLIGVWPFIDGDKTLWKRAYNIALKIISYVLVLCNLIPGFLYWLIQADSRTRIQMIAYLLYEFMTVSQYSIFVFRENQIKQCLQHIEEDWNNILSAEKQNIMRRFVRIGKRLATTCAIIMFTAVVFYRTILPLMQGEIVTVYNVTVRPLACPSYAFSIDLQATPFYEAYFALQCISGIITGSIVTIATGLTAIFVVHASGQLRIVRDLMTKLVEEEWQVEYEVDQKVAEIVNCQIRVRSFVRLVEHTLQQMFVIEVMVNTVSLCIVMYCLISEWQSSNTGAVLSYLVSIGNVTSHIFLLCYTGEQLTEQAEKVAIVSCELEWYRLPDKKARYVVLLMIMSNTPTRISAGNLFDLSLRTFGNAMKAAGAYFNMLRSVT